ncbi:hypothetical protein C2E20_4510 isoform A [Micractinium conductrix]|uniref:Uncharacterized protein n=1 Tax=Micractinium conductrix TaxID=554055 RepID=A0A2P6VDJ8_9CHLO|nr:hypothetical protein C2E20_4510 isoform A [Micractinium conductrix]|eukprot:PSC72158.1 hypothetical protein C2E20_4510 isoform A [Micractinium conductrix]
MQALQLTVSRPTLARGVQRRGVRVSAQTAEAQQVAAPAAPAGGKAAEIYIGHAKDEVEEKKLGKKGRFVVDDPSKYPQRSEYTGGWAGGEKGLKEFVAATQREKELNGAPAKKAGKAARAPQPIAKGSDTIYLGNGRTIVDDAKKYPERNELTGGFAGGELGLQYFKEKGDVPIAPEGQGTKQSSPLITAFVLGLAATGGGLLLSTIEDVAVKGTDGAAPAVAIAGSLGLDEKTKAMLTAGILLVGVLGTVAGAQVMLDSMAAKMRAGASKLAILGAFWTVVFLAAKLVLDS